MNQVLYITANPRNKEQSFSLRVGGEFLEVYRKQAPKGQDYLLGCIPDRYSLSGPRRPCLLGFVGGRLCLRRPTSSGADEAQDD